MKGASLLRFTINILFLEDGWVLFSFLHSRVSDSYSFLVHIPSLNEEMDASNKDT
jgi:hypothetical protein